MLVPEVNGPGFYGDYSPSYPRPTAIFSHNPLNWARLDQESIRLLVFGLRMDSWDSRLVKSTLMVPGGYRRSGQAINEEEKIIFA